MVVNKLVDEEPDEECECLKPDNVDDAGVAFIEWAEQSWAIEEVWDAGMKKLGEEEPNSESAPWSYVRGIFMSHISELAKNKKEKIYLSGYYKLKDIIELFK